MKISWFRKNIIWALECKLGNIKSYFYNKKMKKKYPDYEDNEYNCGAMKHIWGVKSWDDLSGKDCNMYTMNDIDITYHRDTKKYSIGIETVYLFKNGRQSECKYLRDLLNAFTKFMDDNGYSKEFEHCFFCCQPPSLASSANSIEELYFNFRVFVEGYCKFYGFEN